MNTLIIDGTGRTEEKSRTKYLANRVIKQLKLTDAEVLDLYQTEIPFLTLEIIESWKTEHCDTPALKLLAQFEAADQVIFIYPTWNWTVPAIVKAYLDLVIISGRTFGYDERGKSIGYLRSKKAILISTTGGKSYPHLLAAVLKAQDGDNYMKQMLNTLGITNIKQYRIDNTAYNFNDSNGNFSPEKYDQKVLEVVSKIKN